jgi:exosortase
MEKTASDQKLEPAASRWRVLMLPGFALLGWFLAVRHLSSEWTLSEQYHYGWTVPLLALYLVRVRLENAPAAGSLPWSWLVPAGLLVVAAAETVLLPLREANADWRLLGWLLTGLAALVTLSGFAQAGGLPWLVHFAFPALFFFTAVPWPRPLEIQVMQWLMLHNAGLAVELLHWFGVSAEVQGNLIRLSSGTLGVDEACSGIRSLQGSLMATLFVGEIFELQRWRRLFLLLAGAGWALVTNAGRTVFLALATERGGAEALDRWHDPAGYWTLGACVVGVTITGWLLRPRRPGSRRPVRAAPGESSRPDWSRRLAAAAGPAMAGMMLILAGWGATEGWFRLQERSVTRMTVWSFQQPAQAEQFESVEQSSRVRGELRYDFHSGGRWHDAEGRRWVAHYFRWDPGRNAVRTVIVHDPRVCLGASGKEFVQTLPAVHHAVGGIVLPFDGYWFRERGEDVFVFNCVAEDVRRGSEPESGEVTMASRLEAVKAGKRNLGQRRLEVAVWGAPDAAAAQEAFQRLLQEHIRVQDVPAGTGKSS